MSTELFQAIEGIGTSFETFKKANDSRLDALKKRLDAMDDERERKEAEGDRPRNSSTGGDIQGLTRDDHEHKGVFVEWLRNPREARCIQRLSDAQHEIAKKDVSIGTSAAGGYALPKEISRQIEDRVRQLNPFRALVDVARVGSNDFHSLVSMGDGTSGWSSETGTRNATASPTLRDVAPTFGEQYALPTATNWSLQDLFFNVQEWLVNECAADFASAEATAIISGTGSSQPTGILNSTPTTTDDNGSPMRAQDVIEYIPITSPSSPYTSTGINIDTLIDLVGTVRERYLAESDRVAWCMHRLTLARLRKLKSVDAGNYLWGDATSGAPVTLLGYPVVTCDAMATTAAGGFPVLFGNWRRGYLLCDRTQMDVIVDPYSTKGKTSFYVSRRIGGRVKNNDALKAVKYGVS